MSLDPERIYKEVVQAGDDWADKKSAYEALDNLTKSVLAQSMGTMMDERKMTRAEAEMRALASGDYMHHLATVTAARNAWLHAQVRYESIKMLAELRRSEESTKRAEMILR